MIDYVLADLQPAEAAVETGAFKIAGEGVNKQLISIAMPQGATRLQSELNTALLQLQNSGRMADLAEQYLGLDPGEIEPVPTPDPSLPTATPPPAPGCIDSMLWVSDLSYDDQNMSNLPKLSPGENFQKGWRVRNTGNCTWDSTYLLVPVDGNNPAAIMGGLPVPVQGTVAPGQTYDFWVNLVAPIQPGTYVEFWTMRNGGGILFGDRIWVAIEVLPNPTPTPPPTQTPSPTIQFTAEPSTINEGDCSTLAWNTENVQAVYLYPQGEPWQNYGVPGTGTRTVCPSSTTTYELRVAKLDGTVEIRQTTVFVTPNPNAPNITRFTVEPPYPIEAGQCVHITWVVEGAVSNVSLVRNNTILWDPAPMSGSIQDCPPGTGQMVYTLVVTGPGGTSQAQQFINVLEPTPLPTATTAPPTTTPVAPIPTTPPEPTATHPPPVPEAPVIYNFTISPNQVKVGDIVHVTWTAGGGTDHVQVLENGAILVDNAPLQLSEDFQMDEAGKWEYELVASNSTGETTSAVQQLVVTEEETDNPLAGTSWTLLSYYDGQGDALVLEGTTISAQFLADGRLIGSSGCNSYDATYHVDGNAISIVLGFSTQIFCEDAIMQQEIAYLALLERAATFQLTDTQLLISDANGVVILTFTNLVAVPLS
jgi:heat shock protein HslJ